MSGQNRPLKNLAIKDGEIYENELHEIFEKILSIKIPKEEFNVLFKKIDTSRDDRITWDEFLSHMLLEFRLKGTATLKSQPLELPLVGSPKLIKSRHPYAICKVILYPDISIQDKSSRMNSCKYLTASKDGTINYWSADFTHQRQVKAINPSLRVSRTMIIDMIAMPDVKIICVNSAERELRFYDIAINKFELRMRIHSFKDAVVCMSYFFNEHLKDDSCIILGDTNGSVFIITFNPVDRGPFKQQPDCDVFEIHYENALKNNIIGLKMTAFNAIHSNWVSQVNYYKSYRAFISCSKCSETSLFFCDITGTKMQYSFNVPLGISCFAFHEGKELLLTGGPDCLVRAWNPFVAIKANAIFQGHQTPICAIIIHDSAEKAYTLSKDRCIKVWDIESQICIQTYNRLPSELSEYTMMSVVYNSVTHQLVIASMMIAVVICEKIIDKTKSDGESHTKKITCVIYNPLFKVIITTGVDSYIIMWDPWCGRCIYVIRDAHTEMYLGKLKQLPITAATFDPCNQLLITGAIDGSLKVWSFSSGTCVKTMMIERKCKITAIIWLKNRILCTGQNLVYITEFADTETGIYRKIWKKQHTGGILSVAVKLPQTLATSSANGELILWYLESGQPYKIYHLFNPVKGYRWMDYKENPCELLYKKSENQNTIKENSKIVGLAILFLTTRPITPNIGSLLVSLNSGLIQVWSHHPAGGLLGDFTAIHTDKDYCLSLSSDPENNFLITGHSVGYIKVWLMKNYKIQSSLKINMAKLKLEFCFLWKDRIIGRAKRAIRNQKLPMLLSSFRGHTMPVNSVQFIPNARLIASGSSDRTVRLWTFGGQYIATLGTFKEWKTILPNVPAAKYYEDSKIPPDISKIGSSTTLKVLRGGSIWVKFKKIDKAKQFAELTDDEKNLLYGKKLDNSVFEFNACTTPKIYEDIYNIR
ncbi:WD repeat-containing protein on Y chromosome [Microplitis demolitor]|uniref:WD repeat-containing protein on Y chromosome n=1 Tax=Microplitis demolitor TaxID=69319 RepID=UPI00235B6FD4|nr:WD repeat-containing protein on Y chromosome [Microplitis demolitor]